MLNSTRPHFRLCAVSLALALSGCASSVPQTVVGTPPSTDHTTGVIPGWQLELLQPKRRIVLTLRDGTTVTGKYLGISDVADAVYADRYSRSREVNLPNLVLPKLGSGLRLTYTSGEEQGVDFLGFESRYLRVRQPALKTVTHEDFRHVRRMVDGEGQVFEGPALEKLAVSGKVPILTEIIVDAATGVTRVAFESVGQVEVGPKESSKTGVIVAVAAVVAVGVAIAAVSSSKKSPPPPPQTLKLCSPVVSSYDGTRYIPDSDAFGGAMYRKAKRTDWGVLEHMREVGGVYRLKIQKGHAETEFIDELSLLAVDHPPATRVVPGLSGTLHVIRAPQQPLRAVAFDGSNATTLVAKRDGRSWISNPFGRDPENKAEARDGITVEFNRPAGTGSATLALRLENTEWGYYLRHEFLELLGSAFEPWYAGLESPGAYLALEEARRREVALSISFWDGERWRSAGFVGEVGSALPRDVGVFLDLRNVPGERLRVRLDSTVGLWAIDSIEVDYSHDAPIQVREIAPSRVTDQDGRDLTASVSGVDDDEYAMSGAMAWAEAIFPAPPRRPGWERSVVLKSTGYYKIHVDGKGEPQLALVQRLVTEPGAFGQYTLRLLKDHERRFLAQQGSAQN